MVLTMPNTREKLIELMCNAKYEVDSICVSRDWCDGCPAEYGKGACKEVYVADHLIAHGVTVQEWISVKDRLPEGFRYVLLWDSADRDFFMGVLRDNGEWYVPWYQDEPFNITHWMPLPQPPKGE
jgi:hypothetical protein